MWQNLDEISMEDGESESTVLMGNGTIITHICGRTDRMLQGWRKEP